VLVTDTAHPLYGANVDLRENMASGSWYRFDSLLGYQYLHYSEHLQITQNSQPTSGAFEAGTQVQATDSFATRNEFHGLDLGFRGHFLYDVWSLDVLGKVAAGSVQRTVDIEGNSLISVPGAAPVSAMGGLLALSSNIGTHIKHDWTAVPQVGITLGCQLTQAIRLELGYSALWFKVAQPGDQIDLNVNTGLIPPASAQAGTGSGPLFLGTKSYIWVQSLQAGLEIRY
jgi:hypothetical protein